MNIRCLWRDVNEQLLCLYLANVLSLATSGFQLTQLRNISFYSRRILQDWRDATPCMSLLYLQSQYILHDTLHLTVMLYVVVILSECLTACAKETVFITVRLHVMQRTVLLPKFCPSVRPSVRPSVCLSKACIVTKRNNRLSIYQHHTIEGFC